MTLFADEAYALLEPLQERDAENGYALRALMRAIGTMFAQTEEAIRDLGDGKRPWERVFDPDRAPAWLLPFVGQAVGVLVDTSLSQAGQIAQIKEEGAWKRGRPAALLAAVAATLTSPFNLVPNPSLEIGTAQWNAGTGWLNAGATLSRVTSQAFSGAAALQVVTAATASTGAGAILPGTFLAGVIYTASVYVKGNAGGEKIIVGLGTAADNANVEVTLTTSWQRVSIAWTPASNKTNVLLVLDHTAASVVTFFADAAMVTVGAGLLAYFDGDTAGYRWLGQPSESASVPLAPGGSKSIRLIERNSTAWTALLVTRPGETPSATMTLLAAQAQKPGGIILSVEESDLPLIDEMSREIDAMTEGTIDTMTLAQST